MAVFLFQQEDGGADSGFNVACSGGTGAGTTSDHQMLRAGTAGTTEVNPDPGNGLTRVCMAFQSDTTLPEPNVTTWQGGVGAAGNYVVRLNVTSARSGMNWDETWICERTSGGVYNTVASLTGQTQAMDAGTQIQTVNRGSDFSPAAADSTVYIVCVFTGPAHGGSSVGITPSLVIDTPIDDGLGGGGRIMSSLAGAGGLAGPGGIVGPGGGLAGSPEMRRAA